MISKPHIKRLLILYSKVIDMKLNRTSLRTIEILEFISKHKNGCTLMEIIQMLDIPKSSAYDIVQTLLYKKMIVEDYDLGKIRYRMGIHSFVIGSSCLERLDIVEVANKYLIDLGNQQKATVFLAILDEGLVTYLYKYESSHSIITTANIGTRMSPHCTALGKVLLAYIKDEQEVTKILKTIDFIPYTEYTITSMKKYLDELENVKKQGYAIDDREASLHQVCVAAPVFNHNKKIIAAISCVNFYQKNLDIQSIAQNVMSTAMLISKAMGYSL